MTLEAAFGHVIKQLRADRGISQEVLSFESGLDRSFISQLECGVKQPTLVTIFQLAKALQTTPSAILLQVETLNNQ
ncbi:MAG: helix-turn-helix transcriptional regulator [Geobacter sp.]|nr:helix-turn-helix transcriptional regulator [Geobacter sp.]